LLDVYGVRAAEVLDFAGDDQQFRARIPDSVAIAAEVPFAVRAEMAETLTDVFLRRTMLGVRGDLGLGALDWAAGLTRTALGWEPGHVGHVAADTADYRQSVARYHPGRAVAMSGPVR